MPAKIKDADAKTNIRPAQINAVSAVKRRPDIFAHSFVLFSFHFSMGKNMGGKNKNKYSLSNGGLMALAGSLSLTGRFALKR